MQGRGEIRKLGLTYGDERMKGRKSRIESETVEPGIVGILITIRNREKQVFFWVALFV
jgi:hypothetical protein